MRKFQTLVFYKNSAIIMSISERSALCQAAKQTVKYPVSAAAGLLTPPGPPTDSAKYARKAILNAKEYVLKESNSNNP